MSGKGIFMSMTAQDKIEVHSCKLEPCRNYESDYDRVEKDEQTDDYAGFPYAVSDAGFK